MVGGAVEAEGLGAGDDADQPPQVEAVGGEVVGEDLQRRRDRAVRFEVVDRLDQRPAEQERPDAVDGGAGEVRVLSDASPTRRAARGGVPSAGQQLRGERHARRHDPLLLGPSRPRPRTRPAPS